ncbi:DMT family transporter [Oceaniglobus indicus]|uniref:aromatic amino acid exporter YddG n=1 Tax=Oceaniglobus indicus TaxID=2047749 RepID=UPI000C198EB0|nr:DMT family transporter [Oceaniglobus indicus]
MNRTRATLVGFAAILLWSLLALLTVKSAPVPPFQLNALCFAIGGGLGLLWLGLTGRLHQLRGIPWTVYAFGTFGLFGYHALYFSALRLAPPAEAGLIAYLWPLLIVLFSGLLPGETLRRGHVLGALAGFAGAAAIIGRSEVAFDGPQMWGYALALLCALFWSGYSVISRTLNDIPTVSVVMFCVAAAILSAVAHVFAEVTAWPVATSGWLAIILLGAGPVGCAFFAWDIGMKRGDIQLLGVTSYAAPVLSTVFLVGAGIADPTPTLVIAAVLITGGAALAARASAQRT